MYNVKYQGQKSNPPGHKEPMRINDTYFNAGTMVIAPSHILFELLAADVSQTDPLWHVGKWCPEQQYLSRVII